MDENQIGPNINTTPMSEVCQTWPIPQWVKQGPYNRMVVGSNPSGGSLPDYRQDQGHHGKYFLFVFLFI